MATKPSAAKTAGAKTSKTSFKPSEFMTPPIKGEKPDNKNPPIGKIIFRGKFGTRVAPGKFKVYNGVSVTDKFLFTSKTPYQKSGVTIHTMYELAIGLLIRKPDLFFAPIAEFRAEILFQLKAAYCTGRYTQDALARWEAGVSHGNMNKAIRDVRRHCHDMEARFHKHFWESKGQAAPKDMAEQLEAIQERLLLERQRAGHMAHAGKDAHNALSAKLIDRYGMSLDFMTISSTPQRPFIRPSLLQ